MYDEYPHVVKVMQMGECFEDDSGGFVEGGPVELFEMQCFVDTPSSYEEYVAMQKKNEFDRYILYPYRTDITSDMQVVYEGMTYEIVGKPQDQGGWHEIMRLRIKEVTA